MKLKSTLKYNILYYTIILFFFIIFIINSCLIDTDFFHIANSGKWIWEHHTIEYYNNSFIQEDYKTLIQQWLYSILLYGSYYYCGNIGVFIFTICQLLILTTVIIKLLRISNVDYKSSLLIVCVSLFVFNYINCRPQMISLILLYIQFIILELYSKNKKQQILFWLPILTLLEVNLHSSFVLFHFVFLLPYIVPFIKIHNLNIVDRSLNIRPFILPLIFMIGSIFLNPYGVKVIFIIFSSSVLSQLNIVELQPLSVVSAECVYLIISYFIVIYLYLKNKLTSVTIYILAGTSILLILAIRNCIFFSIAVVFIAKDLLSNTSMDKFYSFFNNATKFEYIAILTVEVFLLFVNIFSNFFVDENNNNTIFVADEAIDYICENENNLAEIKLFTDFNTGASFHWYGIGKIYMEAKSEPYIEAINERKDIISEYSFITKYATTEQIIDFLNCYNFDYLYINYRMPNLQTYLDISNDYQCVLVPNLYVNITGKSVPKYKLYKRITK